MFDPAAALPPLREDLALFPAPAAPDGAPTWHLSDPAANRFYQLGWAAFEILSRWELGSAGAVADAVGGETTLEIDAEDVDALVRFLRQHHLLQAVSAQDSAHLLQAHQAQQVHWLMWLLKNYLFVRVPLVRPMPFLDRWVGHIGLLWRPRFWIAVGLFALLTLVLVARQWDSFLHAFAGYQGWEALLSFGLALSVAKVWHELGHAFVARHHGCKVPSMGVAFLVMWPVLYTDTNEAWKLPSHRARFQIGIAGMAAEMLLSLAATFLWVLLPDGGLRASLFFLATTSWVVTLGINVSPFMRFDGYFLLSDALGMPNLHERAFAIGRWWLREKLFGLGLAAPEHFSPRRTRFLIGFALATWTYRLVVFLSIALLVYHAFFKLLGIVLLLVELGWFIVLPFVREFKVWWNLRAHMRWRGAARRSAIGLAVLLLLLVLPWRIELASPAVLVPAQEQMMFASMAATVESVHARQGQQVKAGELLVQLAAPELDERLEQARIAEANWRRQLEQQSFNAGLLGQGEALRSHWQEAATRLQALEQERARLAVRAPFDATVTARNDDLAPGSAVAAHEMLLALGDLRQAAVLAFVGEDDLGRLHVGAGARFVPDAPEFGRTDCSIGAIDSFNATQLDEPALASVYGGRLNVRADGHGALVPVGGLYRVRLEHCAPAGAPAMRLRGMAHLRADGQSLLGAMLRQLLAIVLREGGL